METMILIVIGIFVGLMLISQTSTRPTRGTIVIMPPDPIAPAPEGLGCLPLIAVGLLILLLVSSIG